MLAVAVTGAGRMGQAIQRLARDRDDLQVVAVWKRGDDLDAAIADADVVVDFSLPEATDAIVKAARQRGTPLVCGVSGLSGEQLARLAASAASLPVLYDRNMSLGIAVLHRVVREAGVALGADFSVAIHEAHHVHKKDAPSGTALQLGDALIEAGKVASHEQIRYESERRGEVAGEHTVILESANERLELGHSVTTRDVFAAGALRAATWLVGQPPGLYSMQDVLFGA